MGAPLSILDDLWKDGNWTADEMAVIMKFTTGRDYLYFSLSAGDVLKGAKGRAFCTLGINDKDKSPPGSYTSPFMDTSMYQVMIYATVASRTFRSYLVGLYPISASSPRMLAL